MNVIQEIIGRFKLNVLHIAEVPESFSSEVYKLTLVTQEDVYVKIPFNKDKLFREYEMLEKLTGIIPVPQVLDIWAGDERTAGALLLSAIEGVPCTGVVDQQLAYQIGVYHAKLHNVTMPGYGVHETAGFRMLEPNDWRLYIKSNFAKWQEPCKEILKPELFAKCVAHFAGVFAALPEPERPCVVHMDFRPGNILINDNQVVGIIDYESARGGSSEIDFTKINKYVWEVDPRVKLPYLQGYETIRPLLDLERVLPFYSFYDAFCAVAWCRKRGLEQHKAYLQESISVLERLVGV
ncbi:aminoglycoside phosphotransferase family protein [Paenibacillus sp. 19GGS1-52]|uniref:phosphotransferase family protein n=1 Tax=Paenibacillus sp. 19GGS1-52 TaxID=2758563 RepID=UPI001EFB09CC|nr:aminoglycoside phosphotransferase family protein [Paenibacillus sp. 19GGS1-52]ULO07619.1 aminoglycoside phosphotransferase family protein [Paenibacillus sp. 19GGS1-52]